MSVTLHQLQVVRAVRTGASVGLGASPQPATSRLLRESAHIDFMSAANHVWHTE